MYNNCQHVVQLASFSAEDIISRNTCQVCGTCGPNLWVCVTDSCNLFTGCGESVSDHSTQHFQLNPSHRLTLNSTTFRLWCYECQQEILIESGTKADPEDKSIQANQVYVADITDDDTDEEEELLIDTPSKPRGLTGLQNLGNTCYMNAALQSLSNCPQLTRFMLDCQSYIRRPGLARSYCRLIKEIWDHRRPSYVVPTGIAHGIKSAFPLFRGYTQQDAQEFLRCFLDQLHEELKETHFTEMPCTAHGNQFYVPSGLKSVSGLEFDSNGDNVNTDSESDSDGDYETCDSGLSSEKSNFGGEDEDINGMNGEEMMVEVSAQSENTDDKPPQRQHSPVPTLSSSIGSMGTQSTPLISSSLDNYSKAGQSPSPSPTHSHSSPIKKEKTEKKEKSKATKYRSIISDIFDGRILSSVQCLKCDNISTTRETFQDLSLPIPSREQLIMLRQQQQQLSHLNNINHTMSSGSQSINSSFMDLTKDNVTGIYSWFWEWLDWIMAWILGPTITLQDCLSAFFSADELRGDNMYSCEKCKKLRNGVKYSKVLQLPEILSIHLKRFRHELMYSSKISNHVQFPLEGLDMSSYMACDPGSQTGTTLYDLVAVICHMGTAASGHYTAYALNQNNQLWYEFDDQYVTCVDAQQVANCDAYVLFYRKSNDEMNRRRMRALELMRLSRSEPSLLQFFVSKQWVNRFNTFASPGPITNCDFLCHHNAVDPQKAPIVHDLCTIFSHSVWEYFQMTFGGGPPCTQLYVCQTCLAEREAPERRQRRQKNKSVSYESNE